MIYDILIIGGGPAGLTAALYSKRAGKNVLIIERMMPGGQVALTSEIENYPGFSKIDGFTLAEKMTEQVMNLGVEIIYSEVLDFNIEDKIKKVKTHNGTFEGKTIILCLGASAKQLNLTNEKEFLGKGVSYCASCDGNFFKDKEVAIVGGGNTSLEEALYLSNLAKRVYLIHRRDAFRGEQILADKIKAADMDEKNPIKMILNSAVIGINGKDKVESIKVKNLLSNETADLKLDGLFIAIGRKPDTELLSGKIKLNDSGYIIVNDKMETNIPGVFAAGDVIEKQFRQIITACNDGAIASLNVNDYLIKNEI